MRSTPHHALSPRYATLAKAVPFATAEEAWFWTMAALIARRDGARIVANRGAVSRNCEPDDVVKCLDRLYIAFSQYFDTAVFKVLYIAANLMLCGRTLSKITVADALHLSAYQIFSRDH